MQAYRIPGRGQTRADWARTRRRQDRALTRALPLVAVKALWEVLAFGRPAIDLALKAAGLHGRGLRNAASIRRQEHALAFDDLPGAFDGLTILYISDLHIGGPVDVAGSVAAVLPGAKPDLCILGGDYTYRSEGAHARAEAELECLLARIDPRIGTLAVLGNHDGVATVEWLERLGVTVLVNEACALERDGARLVICGTDDPHFHYSAAASDLLGDAPCDFSIALVHTVELASEAAAADFDLYLAGHSHGGQICWPGGAPIITGVHSHQTLARGLWRLGRMQGYTSSGAGVSGLPVRYNCRGDITLLTLRRITDGSSTYSPPGPGADRPASGDERNSD